MLLLGALYIMGNSKGYSDETLSTIVFTDMLFSLVQAFLIACAIILMIVTIIRTKKWKPLLSLIHYLAAFIIMAVSLSLSSILNFIQQ